jgi:hypothetical protein
MRIPACVLTISILAGPAFAGTATPGPCSLLTKAEVQEAVGRPVSDGAVNTTNRTVCDFQVDALGSAVSVMLTSKRPADSAEKTVAELKKQKITGQVVSGFGDSAYTSSPGYGMQQLGVYKGSSHVIVTVLLMGAPEAKSKAVAEAVMRKALVRLH